MASGATNKPMDNRQINCEHLKLNMPTVPMPMAPIQMNNFGTQPHISPPPGFGRLVNYPTPGINLTTLFPTTLTTTSTNTLHYRSSLQMSSEWGLTPIASVIPPWVSNSAPVPPLSSPIPQLDGNLSPANVSPTFGTLSPPLNPSQPRLEVDFLRRCGLVWAIVPSGGTGRNSDRTLDYHFFWPRFERTFTFRSSCNCYLVSMASLMAAALDVPNTGIIKLDGEPVSAHDALWSFPSNSVFTILEPPLDHEGADNNVEEGVPSHEASLFHVPAPSPGVINNLEPILHDMFVASQESAQFIPPSPPPKK